jgi:hypothetical protein
MATMARIASLSDASKAHALLGGFTLAAAVLALGMRVAFGA